MTGVNSAMEQYDAVAMRTFLENPSLNLGVIDDATLTLFMETLRDIQEEHVGKVFEMNVILSKFRGKFQLNKYII